MVATFAITKRKLKKAIAERVEYGDWGQLDASKAEVMIDEFGEPGLLWRKGVCGNTKNYFGPIYVRQDYTVYVTMSPQWCSDYYVSQMKPFVPADKM